MDAYTIYDSQTLATIPLCCYIVRLYLCHRSGKFNLVKNNHFYVSILTLQSPAV